jgi:hypothetical protein
MKDKYERALIYIGETVVWKLHEHAPKNAIIHDCFPEQFELLKELVDKETELQSRKDKLVVGSVWECVAENLAQLYLESDIDSRMFFKGSYVVISEIGTSWVDAKQTDVTFEKEFNFTFMEDQFLLCFKPR